MSKHDGNTKGFSHLLEAHYGKTILSMKAYERVVDDVTIGFYSEEGGTSGEFSVVWENLGGSHGVSAKLVAWNDSWSALAEMPELIGLMNELDSVRMSPDDFCKRLIELGFKDRTMRQAKPMC